MTKKTPKAAPKFRVRFTVKCGSNSTLSGMVQTEDQDEQEQRGLMGDSGVVELALPEGDYTFVWAVKMTPIQRHRYSVKAERIPDGGGDPVELRKRPTEQTTTTGEDVGFDVFEL
jgi:hypothetical protein